MPKEPVAVANGATAEELGEAIAPDVHDMVKTLGVADRPGLSARVVEAMADELTPTPEGQQTGDLSRLFAQKLNAVRAEFGLPALDAAVLEAEARALGGTLMGPSDDDPLVPRELTEDEVRERTRKARLFSDHILAQPSAKKRATLEAIMASPSMDFFNPERAEYRVNGVIIRVPEGHIKGRGTPGGDVTGCAYIARLVFDAGAARRWELMEQRRLRETIILGDESLKDDFVAPRVERGSIE